MNYLLPRIRKIIYIISIVVAVVIFIYLYQKFHGSQLYTIRLIQAYAFCALISLYLCLLASPIGAIFPNFRYRALYIKARKALGLSAWGFGTLHGSIAFFATLGGFSGLGFLSAKFLTGITLSSIALLILWIMAVTSIQSLHKKLGRFWKPLHRIVYAAGILIVIHALMLGTHFANLGSWIPEVFFTALTILLVLEAARFDKYYTTKFPGTPRFGLPFSLIVLALTLLATTIFFPHSGATLNLGIHAQHLAQSQQLAANPSAATAPRYNVSFDRPTGAESNKNELLVFRVNDVKSGAPITAFTEVQSQLMHLVIVDDQLQFYNHIHPALVGDAFAITTQFPHDGAYHLYINFQPRDGNNNNIEQQFAFTLNVGEDGPEVGPISGTEQLTATTQDGFNVQLEKQTFNANSLATGSQSMKFTITDSAGNPATNIQPYLAAFGHLVMINIADYNYIHVHPIRPIPVSAEDTAGPEIEFQPLNLGTTLITPGTYKLFLQFKVNDKLEVAPLTITLH